MIRHLVTSVVSAPEITFNRAQQTPEYPATRSRGGLTVAGVLSVICLAAIAVGSLPLLALASGPSAEPRALAPELINEAERRFAEMGYWTGPVDNQLDERTGYAVLAFQRVNRRKQTGRLDEAELEAIRTAARPIPREAGYRHIEIDLSRQVLFVVEADSAVRMVLPISSGSGKLFTSEGRTRRAVTPRGRFTVYRRIRGWRKSPLGSLYYPSYFVEGVAIHGSSEVPNYPASHGCIRVPMIAAKQVSDLAPVGTTVLVY